MLGGNTQHARAGSRTDFSLQFAGWYWASLACNKTGSPFVWSGFVRALGFGGEEEERRGLSGDRNVVLAS